VTVALHVLPEYCSVEDVEGGKECCRILALAWIMRE
jgi:hypothetical protein